MNTIQTAAALTACFLLAGVSPSSGETEKVIPLSDVPQTVLAAAQAARPGFTVAKAEVEVRPEGVTFSLEGSADGKACEIEVSSDGKVLRNDEGIDDEGKDDDSSDSDDEEAAKD
jgi:hypothetical protein